MKIKLSIALLVAVIATLAFMTQSVLTKEQERRALNETPQVAEPYKNESYKAKFPRQYSSWHGTIKSDHIEDMLDSKPQLPVLWAGYGFAKDYNAPRGHAFALQDNVNTLRTGAPVDGATGPMPKSCWACKSPDVVRMIDRVGEMEFYSGKWAAYGDEIVNTIGCADCHDPKDMSLAVGRPHLSRGLQAAGLSTFEDSTHQEKRSLVCAQCHSEYYFKDVPWKDDTGTEKVAKLVTFPWANGTSAEAMEAYYDGLEFKDWTHKISKTPMLKAQHPGWEIARTGIHAKKGIACADCHMPYVQEGAIKYSSHKVGSPLENIEQTCLTCHREKGETLMAIVGEKKERKELLMEIAMDNLAKAHLETGKALELGASAAEVKAIQTHIRHAQWRWDYAIASHGSFFHAPEETLKLLASANELAQQARLKLVRILAKYGAINYAAPDFSTKEKAQKLAGLSLETLVKEKLAFKATLEKEWLKRAVEKGNLNLESRQGIDTRSSYFDKTN
ncbi:MAG: ammonia-forming cytochrome c nitrite reductase [bacterium]|nr:ammonia-forming cytochrome c nitrite reductase [bacterium]